MPRNGLFRSSPLFGSRDVKNGTPGDDSTGTQESPRKGASWTGDLARVTLRPPDRLHCPDPTFEQRGCKSDRPPVCRRSLCRHSIQRSESTRCTGLRQMPRFPAKRTASVDVDKPGHTVGPCSVVPVPARRLANNATHHTAFFFVSATLGGTCGRPAKELRQAYWRFVSPCHWGSTSSVPAWVSNS